MNVFAEQVCPRPSANNANSWALQKKLMPQDGTMDDEFSFAVALSSDGNTALVGAPYADIGANEDQGAAYVFTRSGTTWSQQKKLVVPDGNSNTWFGYAVALSSNGNTVLVGAMGADTNQGAAYVFTRYGATWSQPTKLVADDGAAYDYMGHGVALSSNGYTALVGASFADVGGRADQGAAYVFTGSGGSWNQQKKLIAADGALSDVFGHAVALSSDGNTALVSAYQSGIANLGAGYVFKRSGSAWSQQAKLTAADGATGNQLGWAVALSGNGNTALLGTPWGIVGRTMSGAGYVFTRSGATWSQQAKLAAADGREWDDFGYTVALSGDGNTALIGAPDADVGGHADQGAGYLFARSGSAWSQQEKVAAADGATYDYFGCAVALSADAQTVLVGAYYPNTGYDQKYGAAYLFTDGGSSPVGPTIKANGSTNNVSVNYPDLLSVTVEMNAGSYAGTPVDWWIIAYAHSGQWYYLNHAQQWTLFNGNLAFCRPVYQGALFNLPSTTVLDRYQPPRGTYDFWFAVDYPMDGTLELTPGCHLYKMVTVTVQ
ncbi:MAG: FG-GAP repeat protein [Kiritimatiellia bacterium]|nr:FG-GAP repeat protein [Lentisphaerota bacterium]